jgi:hypothetical protein
VTIEQRHAAEQVFLNFKSQSSPYKFCQEIFRKKTTHNSVSSFPLGDCFHAIKQRGNAIGW